MVAKATGQLGLLTVSEMAERLGVARHRIEYLIDARGIRPAGRVGRTRLYMPRDVERLASELARAADEREGGAL